MKRQLLIIALLFSLAGYEVPQPYVIPDGAYGVFQCTALETTITVPLYTAAGVGQEVVDAEDSALIRKYGQGKEICDHADSIIGDGVWNVNDMQVGSTAFLITPKSTIHYQCTAIYLCKQRKYDFTYNGKVIQPTKNDLVCISCAEDDGWVYLAYYKKLPN